MDSVFRRRENERIARQSGRLPPGQSLTEKFPVLHYGMVPVFDPDAWRFKVWGDVEQPLALTWQQFNQLPRSTITMDLHCVTTWSKLDTTWEGVSLRTLLDMGLIKLLPTARYVLQHAEHGYSTNLPLAIMLQENFLLATHFEGAPITPDHGYPLRGVVGAIPGRDDLKTPYLWKGAKWLYGLEFMPADRMGFWERAGYHNQADIWKEERFA
ncbi:MAG: sulfite oxidase-like oxidoreductase [Anaerolineae bacterium]|nr:sulfite oxidase-like oxidoreductase [Anaerolineae bacterium]